MHYHEPPLDEQEVKSEAKIYRPLAIIFTIFSAPFLLVCMTHGIEFSFIGFIGIIGLILFAIGSFCGIMYSMYQIVFDFTFNVTFLEKDGVLRIRVLNSGRGIIRLSKVKVSVKNVERDTQICKYEYTFDNVQIYPEEEKIVDISLPPEIARKVALYGKYSEYEVNVCVETLLKSKCKKLEIWKDDTSVMIHQLQTL